MKYERLNIQRELVFTILKITQLKKKRDYISNMIQIQKKNGKHLTTAYNRMMSVIRDEFEVANAGDMSLQKALDMAQHRVVHGGAVSAEEAFEISEYIKRDINDAAEYMMETSEEFYDWLLLDIDLIERKVVDLFLSVADDTRIELEQYKDISMVSSLNIYKTIYPQNGYSEVTPVYKSGETAGPGRLICENCGKTKPFLTSNTITNCRECGHDRFIRRRYHD